MALAFTWLILCVVWIWSREFSCRPLSDGNNKHLRHQRIRRNLPGCSGGINTSVPEGPPIVKRGRKSETFVDRELTLDCQSYSRTPANITWIVKGRRIKPGGLGCKRCIVSIPLNSCHQQLQIKRAEETDSGNYICEVTNKYGTVNSTSVVIVRIIESGKISIDKVRLKGENQKAILGGSVNITCSIIDPSGREVLVLWLKNGKRADDDDKRLIWIRNGTYPKEKREKLFVLILKNVTVEDEGIWTCAVKGGRPSSVQRKTFTLRTEPCPGGYYCPWRENKKYPCPYGTYTDGSSNGTVLNSTDCLKCPGVPQGTQPIGIFQPAASLEGCPVAKTSLEKSGSSLEIAIGAISGVLFTGMVIFAILYHKRGIRSCNSQYRFGADMRYVHKNSCQHQQKYLANGTSTEMCLSDARKNTHPTLYDVFITYSSKDGDWVRGDLLNNLETRGFRCCIDIRDFLPGNAIVSNIAEAVYQSKKTLAVLSPDFIESGWCLEELQHALGRIKNHQVVPVLYRACEVPLELQGKTYVDWENPDVRPHFWDALERSLKDGICQCSCFRESETNK